jgi:hypothetical protein
MRAKHADILCSADGDSGPVVHPLPPLNINNKEQNIFLADRKVHITFVDEGMPRIVLWQLNKLVLCPQTDLQQLQVALSSLSETCASS